MIQNKKSPLTFSRKALLLLGLFGFLFFYFSKDKVTQEIVYSPTDGSYVKKEGECLGVSRATQGRPNTFRCSGGNEVYDPCFKIDSGKIVCDSNPKITGDEFELTTTTKLPENNTNYNENKRFDWAYELEDGTMCFLIQGTAGVTNSGEPYYYSCDKNKVIVGDIDISNSAWKASISKPGDISKDQNITTAWK